MAEQLRQFTIVAGMLAAIGPAVAMPEDRAAPRACFQSNADDVPTPPAGVAITLRHDPFALDACLAYRELFQDDVIRVAGQDAGRSDGPGGEGMPWVRALRTERLPGRAWPALAGLLRASGSGSPAVFASFEELLRP